MLKKLYLLFIGLNLIIFCLNADAQQPAKVSEKKYDIFKVYMIGNSLTDEVKYDAWIKLCQAGGVDALYARKMIPGSPLGWHQEHPTEGFLTQPYKHPEEAFKKFKWNALTLQPFRGGEDKAALYYANLFWSGSPEGKVFVYAQWPSRQGPDWDALWLKNQQEQYNPVIEALRATPKGKQVFIIPAGWAMELLHKKAQLGLVPGIKSAWDLYSDGVHVNNIGSYLVALTFYATIFGKSPIGLPIGGYQGRIGQESDYFNISPELAGILQQTVWEAVTGHPQSGVTVDKKPELTLPLLPDAVEKEPYIFNLNAAYGKPPYSYSIKSGKLPAGISLSTKGSFRGISPEKGKKKFTVEVKDSAGRTSSVEYLLKTVADTAPKIITDKLPRLRQGEYLKLNLKSKGGNGVTYWSVADGSLPEGMILNPDGTLSGCPAVTGPFQITVQAKDSDGKQPELDKKTFSGTISTADQAKTIIVKTAETKPKIDGILSPEEGWDMKYELKNVYAGKPNNKVRFGIKWFKPKEDWGMPSLFIAAEVTDDALVTREGWGMPHHKMDALSIYFDGLNNRESTYNADDRRLCYGPTLPGKGGPDDREWFIGPWQAGDVKFTHTPTGYIMEGEFLFFRIGIPSKEGSYKNVKGAVIGFDLVNHDVDVKDGEQSRTGWIGSDKNPENPSGFGTLILAPKE